MTNAQQDKLSMEEVFKTIDIIFEAQRKARQNNDFLTLMVNAEALLERIPALINYAIDKEREYRKLEAKLANEKDDTGKDKRGIYIEMQGKASDGYLESKKARDYMDLIYEMVALSKKLASGVNQEFNAQ